MKAIITRADDYGSSHAANTAIAEAVKEGFIKNVSIMACGPFLEEAAELLADDKNICFGLHACINSEWDRAGWGPVAPANRVSTLIDERGRFYQTPLAYQKNKPSLMEIITEYEYQLARVRAAGFNIKYMDSHMFPEIYIPGLQEKMSRMIEKEGLIDHICFNRILENESVKQFPNGISDIEGQVLMILHPARYGEEMCMTGNGEIDGEVIARDREKDYQIAADHNILNRCREYGVRILRYDEAEKMEEPYRVEWVKLKRVE